MRFLFCDDEFCNVELESKTRRAAIAEARDRFQIKGRLRSKVIYGVFGAEVRVYKLINSGGYCFQLITIDD